ncbi:DNA repair protein RecN [Pseudoclavibacter endophyticus]|uniref:DNA repair protein RecN n=1 Tax=Pseudoclavibacter endophyticus TaxID=1778590 RepID=A0A6H9WUP6_9MICO|nr:DNA repair protein RecN [Pseudoclavibacter endophyticus]KAB1650415.1 DNA repair protein RecN [Pseudoclavibacter endophyticus]GGA54311.1 DNA repair protein RecN [Pseudoclavibacter endophyticus]
MIGDIEIRGLGVIDHAELPLGEGFTAITGETGAGKTMIVTALGLLLGGRAKPGTVRTGAPKAVVEGRWIVPADGEVAGAVADAGGAIETFGITEDALELGELLVTRQISATDGRSRAWLGGTSVPAATLADLGEQLVVVHGQSDQLRLRSEGAQRAALDAFGGIELLAVSERVADAWARERALQAQLAGLTAARDERVREAEALRTAIADIEPVEPKPGEDAELLQRIERLEHREEIRRLVGEAHALLRGGDESASEGVPAAAAQIEDARARVERAAARDSELESVSAALTDVLYGLDDAALRLSGYLDSLDLDGIGELDALNERLASLVDLTRRYGPALNDVIRTYDDAGMRLIELEGDDARLDELTDQAQTARELLESEAATLSELRRQAAKALGERVTAELTQLAMPDAVLTVDVQPTEHLGEHGGDRVAFQLRPHAGATPAPIQRGASGGELSRVMLALEVVLADANPVPTLVFDEVDAGVGGAAAIEIGRRLRRLAGHAQVIVVTHLAQVAAFATNHIQIEKSSDGEVTTSSIRSLTGDARVAEITRLLSGLRESESGRSHAEELLRLAEHETSA